MLSTAKWKLLMWIMGNKIAPTNANLQQVQQQLQHHQGHLIQTCKEHASSINCLECNEDRTLLATGGDDCIVRLWSSATSVVECIGFMAGHEGYVSSIVIRENILFSASGDHTVRKWNMSLCECLMVFEGHENAVTKIICVNDRLYTSSYDKTVACWNAKNGKMLRSFAGHKNNITALLYKPADNIKTRTLSKQKSQESTRVDQEYYGHEHFLYEDILLTGSLDSLAKSWSVETGECLNTFKAHTGAVTCLAVYDEENLLLSGSADNTIKSWEIKTGQLLRTFTGHSNMILSIMIQRRLLYSTSSDNTARCWALQFGECTRVYKEHLHSVPVLIENDGMVYTGCGDKVVRCFDAKSGQLKRKFKGHSGAINCLQIVGKRLFTASFDGALIVWDINGLTSEKKIQQPASAAMLAAETSRSNSRVSVKQQQRATTLIKVARLAHDEHARKQSEATVSAAKQRFQQAFVVQRRRSILEGGGGGRGGEAKQKIAIGGTKSAMRSSAAAASLASTQRRPLDDIEEVNDSVFYGNSIQHDAIRRKLSKRIQLAQDDY